MKLSLVISKVPVIQLLLIIGLVFLGSCLTFYGIRIQIKLCGMLIVIQALALFLIKDKKELNMKEHIQLSLTICLVALAGYTVWKLMNNDGYQPITPKNYVDPKEVIEKKVSLPIIPISIHKGE